MLAGRKRDWVRSGALGLRNGRVTKSANAPCCDDASLYANSLNNILNQPKQINQSMMGLQ